MGISDPADATAKDGIAEPDVTANPDGSVTVKPTKDATKVEISYVDEDDKEQTVTVTKDKDGNWTADDDNVVINDDGTITLPADKVKDGSDVTANQTTNNGKSGDSSATVADAPSNTFTPTTTDKDITITVAGDDIVNKAEADKATVPVVVKVTPQNGETVTDVTVTVNGKPYKATPGTNGNYTAQVPSADIKADANKTATAKVNLSKDGKTGTATDTETYTVDTVAPTVKGTRQDDGSVTGTTDPNTAITDKAGKPITDANDKPIVSDAKGVFTIPAGKVPADNTIGAKDKAGNVGTGNVDAPSNTFTPTTTDKDITITVAGDDIVNKAEADKATVPVVVKVTPQNGETVTDVTVTVNGKPYKATPGTNGNYTAQVPSADIKADANKTATAKVNLSKDGKTGTATDTETYTVDTVAPTVKGTRQDDGSVTGTTDPNTAITDKAGKPITDANDKPIVSDAKGVFTIPAGKVPADNTIGAKDKAGNVGTDTVAPAKPATPDMTAQTDTGVSDTDNNTKNNKPSFTVKTPTDGEPVLMVDGKPVEAEVTKNNGTTTLTPKQPIPDGNHTVSVAVTDSAGNTSEPSEALSIVIDTQAPTKPEVTIGKNDDGKITDDEVDASGNVTITVGLPGDAKAGDTVVINNNDDEGTELTDEHIKAGKVEVKVKAPKDGTNLIANVLIKDKAGNQSETVSEIAERKITIPSKLAITTEQTEVTEGGTVTFKVTRTEGIDKESSVKWTLTGSTDNPVTVSGDNSDFADDQPTSGTLTFAPGETEKTIEVKIKDDKMVEKTEGFTVTLSDAKGATVTTDSTSSVIKNNDKLVVGLDKDSYSENPQVGSNSDQYTNNPKVIVSNIPNGAKWEYRLNNGKWKDGNNPNEGKATFDLKPAPDVWQGVSYKIEARVKPNQDYDSNSTLGSLDMTLDQSVRAPIITSVESGNQITGIAEANSFVYIDKDDSGSYSKGDVGTYADDKGKFTLPFGEKLAETGKDALIFGNQGKDVPLARLGVIDEAGNALGKEDMSHFFYFDSLDGRDYFSTATSKTGTTVASTTNLQDIPHTVYVNKVISAGTFNFGSADDVLVQNERYLQNNSYINMGGGDDYAKFNYIRQAGVGSVDMGSGNDILEVGLVGKSSFTGTTIKLGEGDDIVRGGAVDGLRSSLDGGKGHDLWEMTGEGITQNLSSIAGMEMIDLGGRKHKLNVKISDVINNADTATIINGQSYKGLFIKGTSQDTVDLGDNGKRSLGKFVQDNSKAPEGYNAYWDGSNENTLIFIQQGINVI